MPYRPRRPTQPDPTVTRLVEGAVAQVDRCSCGADEAVVVVLRGFDGPSRRRADLVRDRLRHRGLKVRVAPAPVVTARNHLSGVLALPHDAPHVCAFVDTANVQRTEADRIAGWYGVPVVSLGQDGESEVCSRALLRMQFAHGAGSADGDDTGTGAESSADTRFLDDVTMDGSRVAGVAFESIVVAPQDSERGILLLTVDGATEQLPEGSRVVLRVRDGRFEVEAEGSQSGAPGSDQGTAREPRRWRPTVATLRAVSGSHRVERDGEAVFDLDRLLEVRADPAGLVRHLV